MFSKKPSELIDDKITGLEARLACEPQYAPYCLNCTTMERVQRIYGGFKCRCCGHRIVVDEMAIFARTLENQKNDLQKKLDSTEADKKFYFVSAFVVVVFLIFCFTVVP